MRAKKNYVTMHLLELYSFSGYDYDGVAVFKDK